MEQLSSLFKWVLVSSAQASVLVCIILSVQWALGRKLQPRWRHALWLLLVARLCLPWAPESALSVFNVTRLMPAGVQAKHQEQAAVEARPGIATIPADAIAPLTQAPVQSGSGIAIRPFESAMLLWLCVALGLTVAAGGQWVRFWMRLRRGCRVTDKAILEILEDCRTRLGVRAAPSVVEMAHIKSPALFGLLHPALLLPEGATSRLTADEIRFVFLHELSHLKRRDIAVNWLVSALQFAHWFNPLMWYAFYRMRADRELACDSLALSHVGRAETDSYGRTLVSLVSGIGRAPRLAGTVGILESGSQLKRRIAMVKAFRQGSYKWSIPAILVVLALAAVTLTNAETAMPFKGGTDQGASPRGATYLFANPDDCAKWVHITLGPGNEFVDGVARMSAPRGRSFLLNTVPHDQDVAVEVKATNESGPALAWILLRWKDANNFYEIALKKTRVEVWHKHKGQYVGILPQQAIELGDAAGAHVLKAQIVGPVPTITVWLDGKFLWSGKDETGLDPLDGRYVALETEFSTISVQSVSILQPDTNTETATPSKGAQGEQAPAASAAEPAESKIAPAEGTVKGNAKITDDKGNVVYTNGSTTADVDPQIAEIEKKLRKRLPYFDFNDVPFISILEFLQGAAEINVVLDPNAAPLPGKKVTLRLEDASIKSILDLVTANNDLDWDIVDNFVYISDTEGLERIRSRGPLPRFSAPQGADVWIAPEDIKIFDGDYCRFLGATIHSKGTGFIPQVSASFHLGDPDKGGKLIGEGGLGMKAGTTAAEAIPWDAPPGKYEIFVVLDREKKVDEADRSNNRASATITIEAPFRLKDQGGEKK